MSYPWGVDRLSLSVLTADHDRRYPSGSTVRDDSPWRQYEGKGNADTRRRKFSANVDLGLGSVFVEVTEVFSPTVRHWLRVDWNPSRQVYGPTGELVTAEELSGAVTGMWDAVRDLVTVDDWSQAKVTRLDLTADFRGIPGVQQLLAEYSLTGDRSIGQPVESVYWNCSKNRNPSHVIAYNKSKQLGLEDGVSQDGEALGWLRTEVVCKEALCKKAGITRLADISASSLDGLARPWWSASGLGGDVIRTRAELMRALGKRELPAAVLYGFVGWAIGRDMDGAPALAKATLAKYRKLERDLGGISPELVTELQGALPQWAYRLDLDAGTVVRRRVA